MASAADIVRTSINIAWEAHTTLLQSGGGRPQWWGSINAACGGMTQEHMDLIKDHVTPKLIEDGHYKDGVNSELTSIALIQCFTDSVGHVLMTSAAALESEDREEEPRDRLVQVWECAVALNDIVHNYPMIMGLDFPGSGLEIMLDLYKDTVRVIHDQFSVLAKEFNVDEEDLPGIRQEAECNLYESTSMAHLKRIAEPVWQNAFG